MFTYPAIAHQLDRGWVQVIPAATPNSLYDYQVCVYQHLQVLHHVCTAQVFKPCNYLASRLRPLREHIQHLSASSVSERFPNRVVFFLSNIHVTKQ